MEISCHGSNAFLISCKVISCGYHWKRLIDTLGIRSVPRGLDKRREFLINFSANVYDVGMAKKRHFDEIVKILCSKYFLT